MSCVPCSQITKRRTQSQEHQTRTTKVKDMTKSQKHQSVRKNICS